MGIKESSLMKPAGIQPSDVDPKELEMGIEDEKEHTNDKELAKKIALQHLKKHGDYYSRIKKAGLEEGPDPLQRMVSPTAVSTPVIAIAVRGSSTGGLPSGADRNMSPNQVDGIDVSRMSKGQLGGYEPVVKDTPNSELIDKTPINPQINSSSPIVDNPQTINDPHPHQVQKSEGEPPQDVTGASTDGDDTLKLRMAMPKGIDVDVSEGEDKQEYPEDEFAGKCPGCGAKIDTDHEEECWKCRKKNSPQHLSDFLDETFKRNMELLKKKLDEGKHKAGCECGFCKNKGKISEKVKKPVEEAKCTGKSDCMCPKCKEPDYEDYKKKHGEFTGISKSELDKDDKIPFKKGQVNEGLVRLSEAFERMRGLANLGERRVMSNGLWGENVGASEPFTTHWKMDKEKAGLVKVDESKLLSIKETLSKKTNLTERESLALKKIEEVLKKRAAK